MALPSSLEKLLDDGIIDDVKGQLLSGKEASVFIVERREELIAAKVYKPREQRSFKATSSYTEGRNQTRNSRDKRAMQRRSSYGRELLEESWRDMEFRALSEAFHAGVRVPEPILLYEDVLLMELLVDETGEPAPRLADFELPAEVAELLHREIYGQVRLLLAASRIHGDLSAFNILITYKGATLIDLPQVVDASANSQAAEILHRDLKNVTEHLARFDPRLLRLKDCGEALWRHYQRGTLDSATEPEPGRAPSAPGQGRPRHEGARGERRDGPRNEGPRRDGPRQDGPRRDGPRQDGPRQDGPRTERQGGPRGPRQDGPRREGPRQDGPRREGPRQDGPRRDRAQPEIVRMERPQPNGPRAGGPRDGGQRRDEPRPGGDRPRDPRGPGAGSGRGRERVR